MTIGRSYGVPADTIEKLPPMDAQTMAKVFPILMRAVLGNCFSLRMVMAAEFVTMTMAEDNELIQAGFTAGRGYASEAARLREEGQSDPSKPLPEIVMGPACVQVFLVVAKKVTEAGEKVGMANAKNWKEFQARLDGATSVADLTMLIKGFRVSSAFKDGLAKMVFSLTDLQMSKCFQECVTQMGGQWRPGMAPRSHAERVLQLALDEMDL